MTQRVYICAPFASGTLDGIRGNVARAEVLADYALWRGYAPTVPHVAGLAEVEAAGGVETPEVRAAAMMRCLADLTAVAVEGGVLWVLRRENGTLSDGCLREWARAESLRMPIEAGTPREWARALPPDLRARWDAI